MNSLRIGYSPYSSDLNLPGDERRFPYYARRRGIRFELADPSKSYDIVVLSARADITSWVNCPPATRIVYDLIDSYLAVPSFAPKSLLRGTAKFLSGETRRLAWSYRDAIEAMCRRADALVCTTEEQRLALLEHASNVHIILDIHTNLVTVAKQEYRTGSTLNLVWEGLPYTLTSLRLITPVLQELARERPVALHVVTDLRYARYMGRFVRRPTEPLTRRIFRPVYLYEWNPHMLAPILTAADLAVIPQALDEPFAAGKPENKLLLFWRMAVPTIVSSTPAYRRAMARAGLEMACETLDNWRSVLFRYAEDEAARRHAGETGRAVAENEYGESTMLERWDQVFASMS